MSNETPQADLDQDPKQEIQKPNKVFNPFYVPVILVGTAFVATSVSYGIVLLRSLKPTFQTVENAGHPLFKLMESYGELILGIELALLGILTLAIIATDSFWEIRAEQKKRTSK